METNAGHCVQGHKHVLCKMADQITIEEFLRDLPSQICLARRQLFSSDLNACEYWYRRTDEYLTTLQVIRNRFEEGNVRGTINDIVINLDQIVFEIQTLKNQFDLQVSNHDPTPAVARSSCPSENTGANGRPRKIVGKNELERLFSIHRSWSKVAEIIGVSSKTISRRRVEFGMSISERCGERQFYTKISQDNLESIVQEVLNTLPNAGESYVIGACRSRNINVQRARIREAIVAVDPVSRALRRTISIVRRAYHVKAPNSLW